MVEQKAQLPFFHWVSYRAELKKTRWQKNVTKGFLVAGKGEVIAIAATAVESSVSSTGFYEVPNHPAGVHVFWVRD